MRLFLLFLSLIYVVGASYAQRFKTGLTARCDPQEKILAFDPTLEPSMKDQVLAEAADTTAAVMPVAAQNPSHDGREGIFGTDRRCRG